MTGKMRIYAEALRKHVLKDIMPFWDTRCLDDVYMGYITCFDRAGNVTDTNKYIWFQGRQLYIYSLLYNKIEKRPGWLALARAGYTFLVRHAYAGGGRWNFALTRDGRVLTGTNSIYSDYHVAQGLGEYMLATGCEDQAGMQILRDTFTALERNTRDPEFKEIYENTWSPTLIWHDMYLTSLNTASIAGQALGQGRVAAFEAYCLDMILNWFLREDRQLVFEAVTRDNRLDPSAEGRFINPGHALESMWFCIWAGHARGDGALLQKALRAVDWSIAAGWDDQYGGIFAFLDASGQTPEALDWHKATNSSWDDKVWWVHCEALCCLALAYVASGDPKYFDRFEKLYDFCMQHFYDPAYGEWYERLNRDGTVKVADKGTPWKCAYHLVRSLVQIILSFEQGLP